MKKVLLFLVLLAMATVVGQGAVQAAKNVTSFDSTQPRGFGSQADPLHPGECEGRKGEVLNDQDQDLCPIEGGVWTPFYYLGNDGQGSMAGYFDTWKSSIMGNGARDPAFFSTLAVANQDVINLLNAAALACYPTAGLREPTDEEPCASAQQKLFSLLGDPFDSTGKLPPVSALNVIGLYVDPYCTEFDDGTEGPIAPGETRNCDGTIIDPVIYVDTGLYPYVLQPEELLPVTADLCLRCHFTTDWLEGRSEPPNTHAPYLRGQFWGSKFREYPGWPGEPELLPVDGDQPLDSEAGMEGIQCMFCHRQDDNFKRKSNYDLGSNPIISNGLGGYFMMQEDPVFSNFQIRPTDNFQRDPFLCGTCHDVTNPLIKEQNTALAPRNVDVSGPYGTYGAAYNHPIERTFTEWYWSDHGPGGGAGGGHCERCHLPMVFQGAQTWMIEGLDTLWGEVDRKWLEAPYFYNNPSITPSRSVAYIEAAQRSRDLLGSTSDAADVTIEQATKDENGTATVTVRITNEAGHKLPTGFAEGRQMWIHITALDGAGNPVFESGYRKEFIDTHGDTIQGLARKEEKVYGSATSLAEPIKVYEHVSLAKNYDPFNLNGWNILDYTQGDPFDGTLEYTPDGTVSHFDKEFHFVLLNYVEKDNRIPPRGWIPEAYAADGAFVVDDSMPDYDRYIDDNGNPVNYDDTSYTFDASNAVGDIDVTVEVFYQTFNEHYMEFLDNVDTELMERAGGRNRDAPCRNDNPRDGAYYGCNFDTWGDILYDIWKTANYGQPAQVGNTATDIIRDGGSVCYPTGDLEDYCNGIDDDCDGSIDEDYPSTPTECGVGECYSTGDMICSGDAPVDTCTPGKPSVEDCKDGKDNDCDGWTDGADPDCQGTCDGLPRGACNDNPACEWTGGKNGSCTDICEQTASSEVGLCGDFSDNDCDGLADCADPDCDADPACACIPTQEICDDGTDNDCDGLTDCADDNCAEDPACQQADCIDLNPTTRDACRAEGCRWVNKSSECVNP